MFKVSEKNNSNGLVVKRAQRKVNHMKKNNRLLLMALLAVLLMGMAAFGAITFVGSPVLAQTGDDEDDDLVDDDDSAEGPDVPITGAALDKASAAALEYMGEGRVTETEVGDEEGYYEIEITLDNGGQVDVHLDQEFNVLGHEED